jgi:hypothetical protein
MAAGPGKGFVNTSLDELRWTENPKGRHCTWHMKWDEGDGLDHPVVSVLEYAPGAVVPPHYHESDYVSVVLAGDLSVDGRPHKVGDIRFVRGGSVYGLVAGERGCTLFEVQARAIGAMPRHLGLAAGQRWWPEEFATPEDYLRAAAKQERLRAGDGV